MSGFYYSMNASTIRATRNYSYTNERLARNRCRLTYLIRCRTNGVFPRFIADKTTCFRSMEAQAENRAGQLNRMKDGFMRGMLNMEISIANDQIRQQQYDLAELGQEVRRRLPSDDANRFFETQETSHRNLIAAQKAIHMSKYDRLYHHTLEQQLQFHDGFHVNLTDADIPIEVLRFLGLGPKFALPVRKKNIPIIDVLADVQHAINQIPEEDGRQLTRTIIASDMVRYIRTPERLSTNQKLLISMQKATDKFLNQHPEITVAYADKGNKTVFLPSDMYHAKAMQHLSDTTTYQPINDPKFTRRVELRTNKLIVEMKKANMINEYTARRLTSEGGSPPRIYFTIKTHKSGFPVRPVVSTPGSPTYRIAAFVQEILNTVPRNTELNVIHSLEVKNRIQNVVLSPDDRVISLDVVGLYTNIPQQEAVEAAMRRFNLMTTDLSKEMFERVIRLVVSESNYFKYKDTLYRQLMGLAMGLSVAGKLSEFHLDDIVAAILRKLNARIKLLVKYVDDFLLIVHKDDIAMVMEAFNTAHETVKFTLEMEVNGRLPFLDILLLRRGSSLVCDWYSKPMASGRFLSHASAHPPAMLYNIARGFAERVLQLSDTQFHPANCVKIRQTLQRNNYPQAVIRKIMNRALHPPTRTPRNAEEQPTYVALPYIPILGEQIQKQLKKANNGVNVAFKPIETIKTRFTKLKSKVDTAPRGVVYELKCKSEGCGKVYIGESGRSCEERLKEHQRDLKDERKHLENVQETLLASRLPNRSNAQTRSQRVPLEETRQLMADLISERTFKTACVAHQIKEDHEFDLKTPQTLAFEPRWQRRKALEALHIQQKGAHAVNFKRDTMYIDKETKQVLSLFNSTVHHEPVR